MGERESEPSQPGTDKTGGTGGTDKTGGSRETEVNSEDRYKVIIKNGTIKNGIIKNGRRRRRRRSATEAVGLVPGAG